MGSYSRGARRLTRLEPATDPSLLVLKCECLNEIQCILAAYAEFESEDMVVHQRVGRSELEDIEIDIADKSNPRVLSSLIVSRAFSMCFWQTQYYHAATNTRRGRKLEPAAFLKYGGRGSVFLFCLPSIHTRFSQREYCWKSCGGFEGRGWHRVVSTSLGIRKVCSDL